MGLRYRFGTKTASKVEEKALIEKARQLQEDPSVLIPKCRGNCHRCTFKKEEKAMQRISAKADNMRFLEKAAKKGPALARAYAATILLSHQEKAPFLATITVGDRQVSYAKRGTAKAEKLVAVQHFNDPYIRLVGYVDLVKRSGAHLYSSPSGFECSGPADAPDWYVNDVMGKSPLRGKEVDKKAVGVGPFIEIEWHSANKTLRMHPRTDPKGNLFHDLARGIVASENIDDFTVRVPYEPKGGCLEEIPLSGELAKEYAHGKINNRNLVERHMERIGDRVAKMGIFIIDDQCMDRKTVLEELAAEGPERTALEIVLAKRGHMGSDVTAGGIIQESWDTMSEDILKAVAPGIQVDTSKDGQPLHIIQEAYAEVERRKKAKALPKLKGLSPLGQIAQSMARDYRVSGKDAASLTASQYLKQKNLGMKGKALLLAFQKVIGLRVDEWRYEQDARSYSDYAIPFVKELLECPPDEYKAAFSKLMEAIGESSKIE